MKMKAIRVNAYGGPEVLCMQEVETPPLRPGAARLRLNNGQLGYEADILGVSLSCLYDKK